MSELPPLPPGTLDLARLRDELLVFRRAIDAALVILGSPPPEPALEARLAAPSLVTLKEAAHIAGKSEKTLIRWAKKDGIGWKDGGRWVFDEDLVRSRRAGPRRR